jgi:hypothetical protein
MNNSTFLLLIGITELKKDNNYTSAACLIVTDFWFKSRGQSINVHTFIVSLEYPHSSECKCALMG